MLDIKKIENFIINNVPDTEICLNEEMGKHTTFKTGGTADLMIVAKSIPSLQQLLLFINQEKIPYIILGHGSNMLVSDKGIREIVIKMENNLKNVIIEGEKIDAEAGALLADVSQNALEHGLSGMEFACGIPGTLGGATVMNAGAYGREMGDIIEEIQVLTKEGVLLTRKVDELCLGYRTSIIQKNGDIVVKVKLRLKHGDRQQIDQTMAELTARREASQPLEYPSAGSIFKRPEGYYTGQLIQEANLQGYQIGGAQVSEKHAGFIINAGHASTNDIIRLIQHIQETVKKCFDVDLETEVKFIGE